MCRAESPALEQFARDNNNRLAVVGLGTQDDLKLARDFVTKGKITFPMLWDNTSDSWRQLGIRSQPSAVLVAADGRELGRWQGRIDSRKDEILKLAER
ncbi:MAG: TlpA disulfide reductase family protein [Acidimicrobiales bacterium]